MDSAGSSHHRTWPRKACRRFDIAGHAHELTFSCYQCRPLFEADWICEILAGSINRARDKHQFLTWAYVFMKEHVHLVIRPLQNQYSISQILKAIKQPVAQRVAHRIRQESDAKQLKLMDADSRSGRLQFWQPGGGFDRNLISEAAVLSAIEYIHNNPVQRGLCADRYEWRWSSAAAWSGKNPGPVVVDVGSLHL